MQATISLQKFVLHIALSMFMTSIVPYFQPCKSMKCCVCLYQECWPPRHMQAQDRMHKWKSVAFFPCMLLTTRAVSICVCSICDRRQHTTDSTQWYLHMTESKTSASMPHSTLLLGLQDKQKRCLWNHCLQRCAF